MKPRTIVRRLTSLGLRIVNVRSGMDAAELIDPRPNDDAPLAFWHDRLILSVHHDGADAMSTESKIMTGRLVHAIIFRLPAVPPRTITTDAECWHPHN